MLKKLTALSLSLLICLSLLPGKAAAMDVPENETPVQAEDVDQLSPEDAGGERLQALSTHFDVRAI